MYSKKKKHIFKRRCKSYSYTPQKLRFGSLGLCILKTIRYELVYLRFLKKYVKQRHIRRKVSFRKAKFWFFLRINTILSSKTTNSRMGAGVGALVRLAIHLKPYFIFLETRGFSSLWLQNLTRKLQFRQKLRSMIVYY